MVNACTHKASHSTGPDLGPPGHTQAARIFAVMAHDITPNASAILAQAFENGGQVRLHSRHILVRTLAVQVLQLQ
eukprot:1003627-Pelagomonas_calceolata.AAC.1